MPRTSFRRRSAPRRKLVWARQSQQAVTVTGAVAPALAAPTRLDALDQFVAAYGAALIGCTIVRIRGVLGLVQPVANAQNMTFNAYIGDANDIVRGPNANDNYYDNNAAGKDYFAVEPFFSPGIASDNKVGSTEVQARLIDVRSMRKLEEVSQRLIFDFSAFSAGATTINWTMDLSILLMLP